MSDDAVLIIAIAVLIILFNGKPDLHDAMMSSLTCETQFKTEALE